MCADAKQLIALSADGGVRSIISRKKLVESIISVSISVDTAYNWLRACAFQLVFRAWHVARFN